MSTDIFNKNNDGLACRTNSEAKKKQTVAAVCYIQVRVRWLMSSVLGGTWIITIAVGILNFTVCAMRNEFEPFLLGQFTTPVNRFFLSAEVL